MANVQIRPANVKDVQAVYGHPPKRSMKAYAATLDGKTIGVAGLYYFPDHLLAFSNVLPEYRHLKYGIAKGTLKVLEMLSNVTVPVYAVADPQIKGSGDFLLRCGFEYFTLNEVGEVYVWQPQH